MRCINLVHQYDEYPPQLTATRAAYDCWTQYSSTQHNPKLFGHRLSGSGGCTDRYIPTQRDRVDRYSDQNKWSSRIEPAFMKDFPDLRATTKFVAISTREQFLDVNTPKHVPYMTAHVVS